jgi:hypothetical protein
MADNQNDNQTDNSIGAPAGLRFEEDYNTDELKDWYNGVDINAAAIDPADISRAWKVLVVFRDLAMNTQDWERAVGYSHILEDMGTMLETMGLPIPPPTNIMPSAEQLGENDG